MDLKNAPGSSGSGEPTAATDVTFSLSDTDFHKLFEGKKHSIFSYLISLLRILRFISFSNKMFDIAILQEN